MTKELKERTCRVCGCTHFNACPGGCWWVTEDLCSNCVKEETTLDKESNPSCSISEDTWWCSSKDCGYSVYLEQADPQAHGYNYCPGCGRKIIYEKEGK